MVQFEFFQFFQYKYWKNWKNSNWWMVQLEFFQFFQFKYYKNCKNWKNWKNSNWRTPDSGPGRPWPGLGCLGNSKNWKRLCSRIWPPAPSELVSSRLRVWPKGALGALRNQLLYTHVWLHDDIIIITFYATITKLLRTLFEYDRIILS